MLSRDSISRVRMRGNREMEDAAPLFYSSIPLPRSPAHTHTQKKNQGEGSSKLSGQPASQSAPCTLAVSSGLDIEEGSTALLLLLPLLLSRCICIRVWVCVYVCVWKPDEMKCQDWATSRESLSIL